MADEGLHAASMATRPILEALAAPILIQDWAEDEDFGIHPYGSKAKRTLVAPIEAGNPSLIPGHRYLFKKADSWKARQMWSEAIAYQIGAAVGLPVPPCFIGFDGRTGEAGALIEFFYGYPGEHHSARLEHGADLLQGANLMDGRGRPHAVTVNLAFCEARGIADARNWWGSILAFDALIGNTDRHSENWGFLVDGEGSERMAPMFDNGTSLAYLIGAEAIAATTEDAGLNRFISRGRHSCDWSADDAAAFNHVGLCERYARECPDAVDAMTKAVSIGDGVMESILQACIAMDVEPEFTAARGQMVSALTRRRRDLILEALEHVR